MKSILYTSVFIALNFVSFAQVEWGVNAGPIWSKVDYVLVSGSPNIMPGHLKQTMGFHCGASGSIRFGMFRTGLELLLFRDVFRYEPHLDTESRFKTAYAGFKPWLGFNPVSGFWIEAAPVVYAELINEYFDPNSRWEKNPYHTAYNLRVKYEYNRFVLGVGYTKSLTSHTLVDVGTKWDLYFRHIDVSLGVRLGQYNLKKNKD